MGLRFEAVSGVPDAQIAANKAYSRSLGYPEILPGQVGAAAPRLAVVGGGPSIAGQLDQIRDFDGEVWGVNGTWQYLKDHGINSTFYTIDPVCRVAGRPSKAILGDFVCKDLLDDLRGADIEIVPFGDGLNQHVTTSAGSVPFFAMWRGHKHITLFGCDSSFGESTHAYELEAHHNYIWVECGGNEYLTSPQMLMQAIEIAKVINTFPHYINVECGGILQAMIDSNGDHEVTHVCSEIYKQVAS